MTGRAPERSPHPSVTRSPCRSTPASPHRLGKAYRAVGLLRKQGTPALDLAVMPVAASSASAVLPDELRRSGPPEEGTCRHAALGPLMGVANRTFALAAQAETTMNRLPHIPALRGRSRSQSIRRDHRGHLPALTVYERGSCLHQGVVPAPADLRRARPVTAEAVPRASHHGPADSVRDARPVRPPKRATRWRRVLLRGRDRPTPAGYGKAHVLGEVCNGPFRQRFGCRGAVVRATT